MWIKLRCAFFTKDLSWKDAGLSFETYLTDALEKVPWIGDGLCVDVPCLWNRLRVGVPLTTLLPFAQELIEMVLSRTKEDAPRHLVRTLVRWQFCQWEMHPTCICCICPCFFLGGLERWRWLSESSGAYIDVNLSRSNLRLDGMSLIVSFLCPSLKVDGLDKKLRCRCEGWYPEKFHGSLFLIS